MNAETITTAIKIAEALERNVTTIDAPVEEEGKAERGGEIIDDILNSKVLIRTVTMIYTGRVADIDLDTILLEDAAWIADTGRFADALKTGSLKEVEPYVGPVYVSRAAVVDICFWDHDLPRVQK